MKILWIEDFGGDAPPFELAEGIFKPLVDDFDWDIDESISEQLPNVFKNKTIHEVKIVENYPEFDQLGRKVLDYDIVIIDFNLDDGEFNHNIKPEKYLDDEKFHERAGFYIFSYLITNSFPFENIVFMTGEIDSTLNDFLVQIKNMYIPFEPHNFGKNRDGYTGIRDYINQKASAPYITLRRGIIEACKYLRKQLSETTKDWIIFNRTTESKLDRNYICDYLRKLEEFFPLNPPDNKKPFFFRFLKELSAEWEMSEGKFIEYFQCPEKIEYYFKKTCQIQMKLLRNWTSHYQLTDDLSEKEVAFFFMLAMRAWFDLKIDEIQFYEKILAGIFTSGNKFKLNEEIKNQLAKSYQLLRKELGEYNPLGNEFIDLIKTLVRKSDNMDYLKNLSRKLFYQNFWHGLFPASLNVAPQREDKDSVAMFVNFEYKDIPENSFPHFLGKLIYDESF